MPFTLHEERVLENLDALTVRRRPTGRNALRYWLGGVDVTLQVTALAAKGVIKGYADGQVQRCD